MSPGGHLFLRGAPHLALLPHRGGGEERGGEKRLDEAEEEEEEEEEGGRRRRCKDEKKGSVEVQGGKSTICWLTTINCW